MNTTICMNLWLKITVIHTTWAVVKLKPEKNSGCEIKAWKFTTTQVVCITAMINHKFISFSAVHIWSFIFSFTFFTLYGYITNSQYGLIAQSVEHCIGIAEVIISLNPVQDWFFFSGFNFTTAQVVSITAMINHKFISFSAVQIYVLSYIHLHNNLYQFQC